MKTNQIIIVLVLLFVVGGGAFFAGTKYQQNKTPNPSQFGAMRTQGGQNRQIGASGQAGTAQRARAGFAPVNGDIISADDKSITVKLADGSSKIVMFSDNTNINKAAQATKTDLTVGQKVAVMGQTNADGSVTAQSVQLNPITRNLPSPNSGQ